MIFGTGMAATTGQLAAGYGGRALVVTDPNLAGSPGLDSVRTSLHEAGVDVRVFSEAVVDVPESTIAEAVASAAEHRPDAVVAVGGGSTIDLAKVTALLASHPGPLSTYYPVESVPGPVLPLIAVPTTAGTGSEVTPVSVITDAKTRMKVGIASRHLIPRHALCDPLLTVSAPRTVTAHSGMDALAHAVESFMAISRPPTASSVLARPQVGKNLLSDTLALTAAGGISANLARAVDDGDDLDARSAMLYGSLLAGIAFGNAGVTAAHALQFAVGAATGTSHGLGTGLLLPYVMEFNRPARRTEMATLAGAMECADPVTAVHELGLRVGLPASLAEIGVEAGDVRGLAEASIGIRRLIDNNPVPLDVDALEQILRAAWHGEPNRLSTARG
ncbi:iron-containing alcohol dehydrogenase [Streptomyces synnematoformans]|uniref:Iron-containing alcohol dehydrogenase n=1 Tax=Streptomyces synnematoformans TaxID=415721 RepID=A0ABN2XII1_9ACTN